MRATPPTQTTYGARLRHGLHGLGRTARRHAVLVSWLVWALALALCVAWVQRYYQAPAGPPWFGKTLRATTCALVLLVAREWVAIRLRRPQPPQATTPEQLKDRDTDD